MEDVLLVEGVTLILYSCGMNWTMEISTEVGYSISEEVVAYHFRDDLMVKVYWEFALLGVWGNSLFGLWSSYPLRDSIQKQFFTEK